ncbi:MAG: hypothetical protein EHM79_11370 [Geobacter sp.]|nr:MAG: hypothetical protein EHM79_11370 [Geobacter sp.]
MDTRPLKAGMTPLFLPVPPMFERCLGYKGEGRFVVFFWEHFDELCFRDDFLNSGTLDSASWLLFMQHPFVRRHVSSFDFGSADFPARHWLLLDRDARRFFVGDRETVESFLDATGCPATKIAGMPGRETTITLDEFISMAGNIEEVLGQELYPAEMMKRLQEQQAVCSELREWLKRLGH